MPEAVRTLVFAAVLVLAGCGARTDLADLDPEGVLDASRPECLRDADCDDGLDCTEDRCERRVCVHDPRNDRCDDGLFCTGPGRCDPVDGCVFRERSCDDGVVLHRDIVLEDFRAEGRRQAGDVDHVLHAERQPVNGAKRAAFHHGILSGLCGFAHSGQVGCDNGVDGGIDGLEPGNARLGQFDRR